MYIVNIQKSWLNIYGQNINPEFSKMFENI